MLGNVEVKDSVLLDAAKNYIAIKKVVNSTGLNAVAIECYRNISA